MNASDLRELLRRRPFEPFEIYLSDGAVYEIRHPEMMLLSRRTVAVGILDRPETGQSAPEPPEDIDRIATVAIAHIVRVEPVPSQAKGNGQTGG